MKNNGRVLDMTGKTVITIMCISLPISLITIIIISTGFVPAFLFSKTAKFIYWLVIWTLTALSCVFGLVFTEIFIMGLILNHNNKKKHEESMTLIKDKLSDEFLPVKLINDRLYVGDFANSDNVKCQARLNSNGNIDIKIQIDVEIQTDVIAFTDNFDIL